MQILQQFTRGSASWPCPGAECCEPNENSDHFGFIYNHFPHLDKPKWYPFIASGRDSGVFQISDTGVAIHKASAFMFVFRSHAHSNIEGLKATTGVLSVLTEPTLHLPFHSDLINSIINSSITALMGVPPNPGRVQHRLWQLFAEHKASKHRVRAVGTLKVQAPASTQYK